MANAHARSGMHSGSRAGPSGSCFPDRSRRLRAPARDFPQTPSTGHGGCASGVAPYAARRRAERPAHSSQNVAHGQHGGIRHERCWTMRAEPIWARSSTNGELDGTMRGGWPSICAGASRGYCNRIALKNAIANVLRRSRRNCDSLRRTIADGRGMGAFRLI